MYIFHNSFKNAFRWDTCISKQPVSKLNLYQQLTLIAVHNTLGSSSVSIMRIIGLTQRTSFTARRNKARAFNPHWGLCRHNPSLAVKLHTNSLGSPLLRGWLVLQCNSLSSLPWPSVLMSCCCLLSPSASAGHQGCTVISLEPWALQPPWAPSSIKKKY